MRLLDWAAQTPGGLSELRRRTGLAYVTIYCTAQGHSNPSTATILKIVAATDGAVTVEDLMTPVTPKRSRATAPRKRKRKRAA